MPNSSVSVEKVRPGGLVPGLELARGLASIEVFFSHLFLLFSFNGMPPTGRPFLFEALLTWGSEAVVVFFVLSGLVIALSQQKQHRDGIHFIRARLRRLAPLYLIAGLIAFVADRVLLHHFSLAPVWAHLLFLQSADVPIIPCFHSDPPLWSLSFEFYFYLLFAAILSGQWAGTRRVMLWLASFVMMALWYVGWRNSGVAGHLENILGCMPMWLLGVTLLGRPIYFRPALGQNFVLFTIMFLVARSYHSPQFNPPAESLVLALLVAPLLYSLTHPEEKPERRHALVSWIVVGLIYVAAAALLILSTAGNEAYPYRNVDRFWIAVPPVAALAVGLNKWLGLRRALASLPWQKPALFLGRISYAVYVIHWPICALVHYKTRSVPGRIGLDLVLVFGLAWLLEDKVHPYLARKFDRIWPVNFPAPKPAVFGDGAGKTAC